MKRLRQLVIALASVALSGSLALGQAKLGLHVVDANGQNVGYLLDAGDAVIFIDGVAYGIEANRNGFKPVAFTLYYTTGDCSGTAYVSSDLPTFLFERARYTGDGLIHYPSAVPPQIIAAQSFQSLGDDGVPGPCNNVGTFAAYVVPVATVQAPIVTPPFRVVDTLAVSPPPAQATFNDVPTTHPFFQFIEALYASGITAGCQASPPLYCPDATLTRGQMAVFLAKALGL